MLTPDPFTAVMAEVFPAPPKPRESATKRLILSAEPLTPDGLIAAHLRDEEDKVLYGDPDHEGRPVGVLTVKAK